jgi:hypothetical protein
MNPRPLNALLLLAHARDEADIRQTFCEAESQNIPEAFHEIPRPLCQSRKFDPGEIWQLDAAANRLLHARSWSAPSLQHLRFQTLSQRVGSPSAGKEALAS